jgi:hypothetical protein
MQTSSPGELRGASDAPHSALQAPIDIRVTGVEHLRRVGPRILEHFAQ